MWVWKRSFCNNKPYLAIFKRQKRLKMVPKSFLSLPRLQTRISNNTLNLSLFDNHLVPNTLYPYPCFFFTLDTTLCILLRVWQASRGTTPGLLCRLDSTICSHYVPHTGDGRVTIIIKPILIILLIHTLEQCVCRRILL